MYWGVNNMTHPLCVELNELESIFKITGAISQNEKPTKVTEITWNLTNLIRRKDLLKISLLTEYFVAQPLRGNPHVNEEI